MPSTIATIKEIKDNENRVGLSPEGVTTLTGHGHKVLVQEGAGLGAGFSDELYKEAGAELMASPLDILEQCDILVKVKEPMVAEYPLLSLLNGKTLYTYLHLSGVDPQLTDELLKNNVTGIGYETVEGPNGGLPLLEPMSDVAGVLAIQYGAQYLQRKYNGVGMSLGYIRGTDSAKVVVIGAGHVGYTAAKMALKMGSRVQLFDVNDDVIARKKEKFLKMCTSTEMQRIQVLKADPTVLNRSLEEADLLVGAVLVAGTQAPCVVSEEQIRSMKKGAVVVDVAIDQGGCMWGSKPTSHTDPIYEVDGKVFCCITNMPGQVAKQSTQALTSATLPYLLQMADKGVNAALLSDPGFLKGINTYLGKITCHSVAEDLKKLDCYAPFEELAAKEAPVVAGVA
jgi:alanine dehydrogenase